MESSTILAIILSFLSIGIFVITIMIFKDRLSAIEFDPRKIRIRAEFVKGVDEMESRAKYIEKTTADSGHLPAPKPVIEFNQQSQRDFVLEAWGALKQIVFDACTVKRIRLSPSTEFPEALRRLRDGGLIGADIALFISTLYSLGEKIANARMLTPPQSQARSYTRNVYFIVDWINKTILAPPPLPSESKPRDTIVGPHFPEPQAGYPIAWLVGMRGTLKGQQFPVNTENYRIGSKPNNDLCIKGDDYVSGNHAYLSYQKGSLFLFDQDSRNGTYLNDKQVTKTPSVLRNGDHIRLGDSIFQVTEMPPSEEPSKRSEGPI